MIGPRIVAIVPMRHFSERVPGKNYRSFAGKPLYRHIIESLVQCPQISAVMIDTDSPVIMEDAKEHFPQVKLYDRPVHLRDGMVPMNDILLNDVKQISADYYLQTHSTNPLLHSATIQKAISEFLKNHSKYDSLFTVTRIQSRLWDKNANALNHDPKVLLRTQDLPPVYEENSCLYIFKKETLESRKNRIGENPLMFEIDRIEAWDIDEEIQFQIAESLFITRKNKL
jgi:CMP-N-acetylneuraminic acid synthetase